MKLISCYTPSHKAFIDEWFLPSIPEGLEVDPIFHDIKSKAGAFMDKDWTMGVKSKSDTIIQAIKDNWNDVIVYADVDIQFLAPVKEFFENAIKDKDIVLQRDDPEGNFCTGLFVARCNDKILKLWEDVRAAIEDENRDQLAFNRFIRSQPGLRYGYLPVDKAFGGGTFLGRIWKPGMRLHIPREPLIHHANWVVGIEDKIAQMKYVKKVLSVDRPALRKSLKAAPEISVITPVHNGERYIEECLLNVIDQNVPQAEHIIVDGGSTDKTMEIVRSYAQEYPHIRWISEKDNGQSHAMNKGLMMARGRVVGFLNADDFYESGVLNRALTLLKDMPEPAFVVANCNVLGEKDTLRGINRPKSLRLDDLLLGYDINPFPVNPSAYFYTRSLHERIGFYNEGEHFSLDVDLIFRAAQVFQPRYVDEVWGNFRFKEGTKTHTEWKDGRHEQRMSSLLETYVRKLPWHRRMRIKMIRAFFFVKQKIKYYLTRVKYYMKTPDQIAGMFQRKLKKVPNNGV